MKTTLFESGSEVAWENGLDVQKKESFASVLKYSQTSFFGGEGGEGGVVLRLSFAIYINFLKVFA